MKRNRYDSIINDSESIKMSELEEHLLYEKQEIVINFFFSHRGIPNTSPIPNSHRRIELSVFRADEFPLEVELKKTEVSTLIVVNSDDPNYAMTFQLQIDSANRRVNIQIADLPELGQEVITEEEKNGVQVAY